MISLIKRGAILLLAFFAFNSAHAQTGTKILSIDSINQLEPIIMFDTTDFVVGVSVDDTSAANNDSITGNLFYYYQTDSMINAGAPPRLIADSGSFLLTTIHPFIFDTVGIDIRPDEIRTTPPINLIILWPAMTTTNWELCDTDSIAIYIGFDGYIGLPPLPEGKRHQVVFPVPAIQYIYIKQEEIELIRQINMLTLDGKLMNTYEYFEYQSGYIHIDTMAQGTYLVELIYKNGQTVRTKIIKH